VPCRTCTPAAYVSAVPATATAALPAASVTTIVTPCQTCGATTQSAAPVPAAVLAGPPAQSPPVCVVPASAQTQQRGQPQEAESKARTDFPDTTPKRSNTETRQSLTPPSTPPGAMRATGNSVVTICSCPNKGKQHNEPMLVGEKHLCETCGHECDCNASIDDVAEIVHPQAKVVYEQNKSAATGQSVCVKCGQVCVCERQRVVKEVAQVCVCANKGRQHREPMLVGEHHTCESCGHTCDCNVSL
jgi:hypothetical protein